MFTDAELFTDPVTFMGVKAALPGPECRAAVLGIPFDCGVHPFRVGARQGPAAVRNQSALIRRFNPVYADFDPTEALNLVDCGDVRLTPGRVMDGFARIEAAVSRVIAHGAVPITIGGDGSISLPIARAVSKKLGKPMVLLHIDSHTDSYSYHPDDRYNAATQFTHVAEEGLVDARSSWHVGIRGFTYCDGVVSQTESLGYRVVSLDQLMRRGFGQTMAEFREGVAGRPVYICFDMDIFDPSVAPGVASPTWGGLTAREGIDLIRTLTDLDIVAVDINTVSPAQDVNNMAAHLCAHVAAEFMVLLANRLR